MVDDALTDRARLLPALLACAVVALQIGYPLAHGSARDDLTVLIVVVLALTSVAHAAVTRGLRVAGAVLLVTAVPGWAVEALGVHTGVPFGDYTYAGGLGPSLLGAPLLIGLAWTMLAWPAAVVARRLARPFAARVLVGGWALAAADLFLDPQQVAAGHWAWQAPSPHLPGVPDVPLTNYAGWLLVALLLSLALQTIAGDGDDTVMVALYLWLYVGWIVALAVFQDLAAAAAWGALGMGAVAVPLAIDVAVAQSAGRRPVVRAGLVRRR
jgi:putative membrane protein